jgi:hypothetical protein
VADFAKDAHDAHIIGGHQMAKVKGCAKPNRGS